MGHGAGINEVAWLDCAGGGQVVVDGNFAYIGHMDPPHGTSVVDVSDPRNPRIVADDRHPARAAFAQGARRQRHDGGEPRGHRGGTVPDGDFVGLRIFDIADPRQPARNLPLGQRRHGRAPLHLRRPLRLHLAGGRGLCRQHRDDPRPGRSGESAGGRALVDARPMDRRRRDPDLEGHASIAAIIRSAAATGCMSATGTAAASSSTSAT